MHSELRGKRQVSMYARFVAKPPWDSYTRWAQSPVGTAVLVAVSLILAVILYKHGNDGWAAFFVLMAVVRLILSVRARFSYPR
jgi:hypothetical protein